MELFSGRGMKESFARFEGAAAKGHEESLWILSVVKDVEMEKFALIEVFAKTEELLGWYFAGQLSPWGSTERFDFYKKSAEGGCSWGQVLYAGYFRTGNFVEKDLGMFLEWLEKAAKQNNPQAMDWLGDWFREEGGDMEKAVSYYRAGAELGWKRSMRWLSKMLRDRERCEKDLRQAVIWSGKGGSGWRWNVLEDARRALKSGATETLGSNFDQLCYLLGWGLYWYRYGSKDWNEQKDEDKAFGSRCLRFYCSCVELQQKSIFTFLWFWNRTTGVEGPGQMIAQMVWEEREDNLMKRFEESDGEEPETKRIKK
jgi:TPR repeat protein